MFKYYYVDFALIYLFKILYPTGLMVTFFFSQLVIKIIIKFCRLTIFNNRRHTTISLF